MRFELTPEQDTLLQETRKLLAASIEAQRAAALGSGVDFDAATWRRATLELGLPAIAIPEEMGGSGGSFLDLAVVLEAAGLTLTTLPLLSVCGSAWLLAIAAHGHEKDDTASAIANLTTAIIEGAARPTWADPAASTTTTARGSDTEGWRLAGTVAHVIAGPWLTDVLVFATTSTGDVRLFRVAADTGGLLIASEESLDPTRPLASLTFSDADAVALTAAVDQPLGAVLGGGLAILLAAEQVGVAQAALDQAVEYATTRHQFGRAIGSFQALKHLLADLYVDVQVARDTMRYAAWSLSDPFAAHEEAPALLAHLTQSAVAPRADRVTAGNLQVLGAIGYTWEHTAHLYYKRSLTSSRLIGTADEHLDALGDGVGLPEAP